MPLITETYYLSLIQDNRGILRLRCSQDDTLRTVNLKLYNNGSIFTIPSGISAYVSGVKQNGAVFSKSCTISQDRKSVVLQLSSDITNVDGIIVAEVVLNDGNGDRIGTSNFIIQVEKNPIRVGVIQDTETPIEYVNDFITQIQALTARLNNLITPSGDPSLAEVVDARISSLDNNTYQNLKARIDADIAALNTRKANKSEVYTKAQVDTLLDNVEIDVDDELSDESENPVQNKVINRAIGALKADLSDTQSEIDSFEGISDNVKVALLDYFAHVAWTDEHGQDYYDALYDALYNDGYPKLTVEYDDRGHIVLISDNIDSLKEYITVKYFENSSSTGTVIPAAQYTLSGTLSAGSNMIRVTYSGTSSSFVVNAVGIVVPETYERKDYIKIVDSYNGSSTKPSGAMLRINVGGNLNQLSYYADFYLEDFYETATSGGYCLFGGRSDSGSASSVALYYHPGTRNMGCHVHGVDPTPPSDTEQTFTIGNINHTYLINRATSPSVVGANDKEYSVNWANDNVVNSPLNYFTNMVLTSSASYLTRHLRNGVVEIKNVSSETVHYLIPVIRKTDNVIGIYDGVTGQFVTTDTVSYATIGNSKCLYEVGMW